MAEYANCAEIIIEKTTVPVKTAKALEHEARPTQEAITCGLMERFEEIAETGDGRARIMLKQR